MLAINEGKNSANEDTSEEVQTPKKKKRYSSKNKRELSTQPPTAADQDRIMLQIEEEEEMYDDGPEKDDQYFVGLDDLKDFQLMNEVSNNSMHDVRVQNEWYNRIKVVEFTTVFLSSFGISLSIVRNELRQTLEISLENEYFVLQYDMIITLLLCLALYFRYEMYLHWYMARGLLTEFDTLISTGWWKNMVFE